MSVDLRRIEARCWTLAGERMREELFIDVVAHCPDALGLVEWLVDEDDQTVAETLGSEAFESRVADLDFEEGELLVRALMAWAGEKAGPDVTAFDALAETPPKKRADLRKWILQHGIRERLADPLQRAAPLAWSPRDRYGMMVSFTIGHVIDGRAGKLGVSVDDAVAAYLGWAAGRRALAHARAETWEKTARSEPVAAAARRVRALVDALDDAAAPVIRKERVRMGPTEDALGFALRTDGGSVWLSFAERSLAGDRAASALDEGRFHHAPLLKLAAEHALDALLDPSSPHHEAVCEAVEKPRWTYLVADLEQRLKSAEPARALSADERLSWRIDVKRDAGAFGALFPAVQKRGKRGWSAGRQVRVSWLLSRPGPLNREDRPVVEALQPVSYARGPSFGEALDALVGHPHVVRSDQPKVGVQVRRGEVEVVLEEAAGTRSTLLRFRIAGARARSPMWSAEELLSRSVSPSATHVMTHRAAPEGVEQVVVAPLPHAVRELALAVLRWDTAVPPEADEALLALMRRLPGEVTVELPPRLRGEQVAGEPRPVVRLEPTIGRGLRVGLRVRPLATGPAHLPGHGPRHLVGALEGRRVHVRRDLDDERARATAVANLLGLSMGAGVAQAGDWKGAWEYRIEDADDALDVVRALADHPTELTAEWPTDVWSMLGTAGAGSVRVRARQANAWFEIGGGAQIDETRVSLVQMVRALRDGRRYVELKGGRFVALEAELREALGVVSDVLVDDGKRLLAAPEAGLTLEREFPGIEADAAFRTLSERMLAARSATGSEENALPPLPELQAELRHYQEEGVAWLRGLARWSSGACLADDMGLGKTLQSIALLLDRAGEAPALVVAPTSVADNWRREMERFAPTLRPRLYRGPKRKQVLGALSPGDVLITSYGLLTRDIETLAELTFSTLVLDEAHALKNLRAHRTKAARRIDAGFTLGLTGTPIENHLGELFSLFDVLVPGLLGTWEHFRARFAAPIERDGDLTRRDALSRVIRPFLLRRQKSEVAPELPPRTEVVRMVELTADERARYETERRAAKQALEESQAKGEKARFQVLAALTRMRRLVCHPSLVDAHYTGRSAKLEATLSLAKDLAREGHRALLFSQFTGHLSLVRRGLAELGFDPLYLDGATPAARRGELVDTFQQGDTPFFLISLKAGGTGLNLTAADTVIHLDPWWNPAAEDQASDRAHRIGQDRPVTVVRLVAEQTLEESVLALHAQKRELARGVLEGSNRPAPLDVAALLSLLSE
ncbi:MAG: DEAD/DEAH box helicase [Sandaracinaceae bacterium]